MQFFWYDYETFGTDARKDRVVQFAGIRTDADLNTIDEPVVLFCRLTPDYLPSPSACVIHGITPSELQQKGCSESEFAERVYCELTKPETCMVGYNAMRFDHEVTRFLFWRNLRDPYAWHWKDGNSRWDVIDLMRATYALRPAGIQWPTYPNGKQSFRLEDLARANGVLDGSAHDALVDVKATLELARLVRNRQSRLFDYYLGLCDKGKVAKAMEQTFVWVSHQISPYRHCTAVMAALGCDLTYDSVVYAYDLASDPSDLVALSEDELYDRLFPATRGKDLAHLYAINQKKTPFVVRHHLGQYTGRKNILGGSVGRRLGIDETKLRKHLGILQSNRRFAWRIRRVFERARHARDEKADVDQALYEGFIGHKDRRMLDVMLKEDPMFSQAACVEFADSRLPELVFRYRARNFPEGLSAGEQALWVRHCRNVHLTPREEDGTTAMDRFTTALAAERAESPDKESLLDQWEAYGKSVREALERGAVPAAQRRIRS